MKSLDHYKARMAESSTLSDLEKSMLNARDLINSDIEKIENRKQKLLEKMSHLEKKVTEKIEIRNQIEVEFQQKMIQIASNLTTAKRKGRKKKLA